MIRTERNAKEAAQMNEILIKLPWWCLPCSDARLRMCDCHAADAPACPECEYFPCFIKKAGRSGLHVEWTPFLGPPKFAPGTPGLTTREIVRYEDIPIRMLQELAGVRAERMRQQQIEWQEDEEHQTRVRIRGHKRRLDKWHAQAVRRHLA